MIPSQLYCILSGTAAGSQSSRVAQTEEPRISQTNASGSANALSIAREGVNATRAPMQGLIDSGGAIKIFFSPKSMAAGGASTFISDAGGEVFILDRQLKITATLTGFSYALGLTVDKSHNLYVADGLASRILVFAPPYNGTPKILSDPGFQPNDVAVDSKGNVAVTNLYNSSGGGPGGIVFYAKGATNPTKSIPANGTFSGDYFCAFDASGNLYVDSLHGSGPFGVGEVVGGIAGTKVKPLTTNNIIQSFGGIEVTAKGRIAILAEGNYPTPSIIYAYDPPHGGSLRSPVTSTPLSEGHKSRHLRT